ncbi:MAG: LytR/AlgR family response regulator transcription factor [Allomuricauda sp.]
MKKINCVIIDDEPLAIEILETYIKTLDHMYISGSYTNALEALPLLANTKVDVIFLDINMSKINGLDFLRTLKEHPMIIITTAYREYALESYDFDVLDYLVKPIPYQRFLTSINKLANKLNTKNENVRPIVPDPYIFIKVNKKMLKINLSDILFIESLKDYILLYTKTQRHIMYKSLSSIAEELPSKSFVRVHKSYVIAIDKVVSLESNQITIAGHNIPIGRTYSKIVKEMILSGNVILPKNFKSDNPSE